MATHSIWVLEYAWAPAAPAGAIVFGDYDKPPRKLPYACILLRGPGVVAMVDAGYNAAAYGGEMADRIPSIPDLLETACTTPLSWAPVLRVASSPIG
jgi:hypothetical protein